MLRAGPELAAAGEAVSLVISGFVCSLSLGGKLMLRTRDPLGARVARAIGRCSQAVVYALWPSYFRGNMMTIDKKLEMY